MDHMRISGTEPSSVILKNLIINALAEGIALEQKRKSPTTDCNYFSVVFFFLNKSISACWSFSAGILTSMLFVRLGYCFTPYQRQ